MRAPWHCSPGVKDTPWGGVTQSFLDRAPWACLVPFFGRWFSRLLPAQGGGAAWRAPGPRMETEAGVPVPGSRARSSWRGRASRERCDPIPLRGRPPPPPNPAGAWPTCRPLPAPMLRLYLHQSADDDDEAGFSERLTMLLLRQLTRAVSPVANRWVSRSLHLTLRKGLASVSARLPWDATSRTSCSCSS